MQKYNKIDKCSKDFDKEFVIKEFYLGLTEYIKHKLFKQQISYSGYIERVKLNQHNTYQKYYNILKQRFMEKSIKDTVTEQNLLKAFAGESQARMRYTYFASVAKKEGYEQIAGVFEDTANQEKEHANRFFNFLEGGMVEITASYPAGVISTTEENLKEAAAGEYEEWAILYPAFADIAEEEGFKKVATAFRMISRVEKEHEARYRILLERVIADGVFSREEEIEWQCRACGYVHTGKRALAKCPACEEPQAYFEPKKNNY